MQYKNKTEGFSLNFITCISKNEKRSVGQPSYYLTEAERRQIRSKKSLPLKLLTKSAHRHEKM